MARESADRDVVAELARRLERSEELVMATAVRIEGSPPCRPGSKVLLSRSGPLAGTLGCAELDAQAAADVAGALGSGEPGMQTYRHEAGVVEAWLEPYPSRPLLVVLGATPVATHLLRWAPELGWSTALVEGRPDRVTSEQASLAGTVAASARDLALEGPSRGTPGPGAAPTVDAVHTDHDAPSLGDDMSTLLACGARFLGMMGSARHVRPHLERLASAGVPPGDLDRVRTPVGLDIGGANPAEIALSIMAGLVAARSGREGGWLDRRQA